MRGPRAGNLNDLSGCWGNENISSRVTCGEVCIEGGISDMHPEVPSARKIERNRNMIPLFIAIPITRDIP